MTIPATVPPAKQHLLGHITTALRQIPGVEAVVLGGSYARGTQHEGSDLDVGIYYAEAMPFSIDAIRQVARSIAKADEPVVTDFYEWGPWVNGGAWIDTTAGKVDFLYRNLDQVQRTIEAAHQGVIHHDYGQQPAYGFYSVIYLAECEVCVPLADPAQQIARLKRQVVSYPPKLKERIIRDALWSAEFTLEHARVFGRGGDVYNTAGCLTRIAASLTQALFALNERYFMSDKQVLATLANFSYLPSGYVEELTTLLACPGDNAVSLSRTVASCQMLWASVVDLAEGRYQPRFALHRDGDSA